MGIWNIFSHSLSQTLAGVVHAVNVLSISIASVLIVPLLPQHTIITIGWLIYTILAQAWVWRHAHNTHTPVKGAWMMTIALCMSPLAVANFT